MNVPYSSRVHTRGSVLVIVLLIAFGMVSLAIYFANSMSLELRAADNRASGLAADQAIEGAARYVSSILSVYATNGVMPDPGEYRAEAVPVGASQSSGQPARFWLIGRDPGGNPSAAPYFGLVDEASKLDLNARWVTADVLATNLPRMTYDFADAIADWRDTNGGSTSLDYASFGYLPKHNPFETVDELRLVYGATVDLLAGNDLNRNGVLDPEEQDRSGTAQWDPGIFEYVTVYSRQPNQHSDGTARTNVNTNLGDLRTLLQTRLGTARATAILQRVTVRLTPGPAGATRPYHSLLDFYLDSQMTADEFTTVYNDLTVTNAPFTVGRINVNTAPAAVLMCLPGMDANAAQQLVSYRETNAGNPRLLSIAWIVDALGSSSPVLAALRNGDYTTTQTYQFTADVAAVGPFGRGYRRVKFIFDISDGTPRIVYRQDLSRLGWALGRQTRETWVVQNTP